MSSERERRDLLHAFEEREPLNTDGAAPEIVVERTGGVRPLLGPPGPHHRQRARGGHRPRHASRHRKRQSPARAEMEAVVSSEREKSEMRPDPPILHEEREHDVVCCCGDILRPLGDSRPPQAISGIRMLHVAEELERIRLACLHRPPVPVRPGNTSCYPPAVFEDGSQWDAVMRDAIAVIGARPIAWLVVRPSHIGSNLITTSKDEAYREAHSWRKDGYDETWPVALGPVAEATPTRQGGGS